MVLVQPEGMFPLPAPPLELVVAEVNMWTIVMRVPFVHSIILFVVLIKDLLSIRIRYEIHAYH